MEQTRIYKLLKELTIPNFNRFEKFLNSPYFNKNVNIKRIFDYLYSIIKQKTGPLRKEAIWSEILLEDGTYNDLKFRKLCNDLLNRFENFLINEELKEKSLLRSNLLLDYIGKNKIDLLIEKQLSKLSKQFEREIDQSGNFYLQKYFYKKSIQDFLSTHEKKANTIKVLSTLNYSDVSINLDAFYVIEKLRYAADVMIRRKMFKTDIDLDIGFANAIIEKYDLDKILAVNVYKLMYLLMSDEGSSDDYQTLKGIALEHIENFPPSEQRDILEVMLTYCIKGVNKGDLTSNKEIIDLYDWSINNQVVFEQGYLSPTTYRNYVVCALRIGLFDKVEIFIQEKSIFLDEARRENAINFNMARLSFYREAYSSVVEYLNKVNYDDVWYNVNSKILLMAAYYELEEYDVLESALDSYTTYLKRGKSIHDNYTKMILNYNSFIRKLLKINSLDKPSLSKLLTQLEKEKLVSNKPWLVKKIKALL